MSAKSHLTSVALVAVTVCALTGCSKSSSKNPSAAAAASALAALASGGAGGAGGAGGPSVPAGAAKGLAAALGGALDVSKQCKAIKPADAQALMKATLAPVQIEPLECDFAGGTLKVNITLDDAAHKQYTMQASPTPGHEVSGVGDQAFWFAPVEGHTTPWLESYKGSVACEVSPADPADTTLVFTGNPPIVTIADSDAAAYAQKEGAVCNDVFAAGS
jgi:hypothetical protein